MNLFRSTDDKINAGGFQGLVTEPTPPSDYTPLGRRCAAVGGACILRGKETAPVGAGLRRGRSASLVRPVSEHTTHRTEKTLRRGCDNVAEHGSYVA
jgi:hypothetical protein